MSEKLLSVFVAISVAAIAAAAPASARAAGPQAPAAVDTYTGCLSRLSVIVQVAVGDTPANPPCRDAGAQIVHFAGGDLTSLTAGTGLTGGGVNGDLSIALAPSFRLPQTCAANQGTTWNGSAWACASLTSQAVFDSLVSLLGTPGTINQGSNPVHWTKLKGVPAGLADGTDDVGPAYSAGFGLLLAGTQFNVEPGQVQRRVVDGCAEGSSIRAIAQDGSVTCQPDSGGTAYSAGEGLNLSGTQFSLADGGVTPAKLSFDPATQSELDNGLGSLNADNLMSGTVPNNRLGGVYSNSLTLANDNNTFIGNGFGLTSLDASNLSHGTVPDARLSADVARYSSISSPGTVNDPSNPLEWSKMKDVPGVIANPSQLQRRVAGTCGAGSAIRSVNDDGTVACEPISGGSGGGWGLTGTGGTDDSNFIGTTDDRPLNFKVNGQRALRLEPNSQSPNVVGGNGDNGVASGAAGATIGGGGSSSEPNSVSGDYGTVAGGYGNQANGPGAFVGGGFMNRAEGQRAVVPGGSFNEALGDWSFAGGAFAHADHYGSFVWNGGGAETHSTGIEQFVVHAAGGLHLLEGKLFCDGCVTNDDLAPTAVPGVRSYCSLASANPASYPDAPCRVNSETVDSGGDVGDFSSIAIGTDGNPVISYVNLGNHDLKVARCDDASCSGGNEAVSTVDALTRVSDETSLAIGRDGNPVISYYDEANGDLRVAACNDPACSGGNETLSTVDSLGNVGIYNSIAIGTDGNPVISYYDGRLKLARCNDQACSGADESISTLDAPSGFVGLYPSLKIGSDGNPVISYWDATRLDLRLAHCNNPACSHADVTIVDSAGNVGQYTSLAIGTDGNPVISYLDQTNSTLKVAHCDDVTCTGSMTQSNVDSQNDGWYTSIAIGADGNPVISYFAESPHLYLKLARCNDPACTGADEAISVADPSFEVGFDTSIALGLDGNPVISHYDLAHHDLKVTHPATSD